MRANVRLLAEQVETRILNRADMARDLLEVEGLVCMDVIRDGNCGVEVSLRQAAARRVGPANLELDIPNLSEQMSALRLEVEGLWHSVLQDSKWQAWWSYLCRGHVDLRKCNLDQTKFSTPKKRKSGGANKPDLPFTPENPSLKKKGKVIPRDGEQNSAIVVLGTEADQVPKKKRTGKAGPIQQKINFEKYFAELVSDAGVTYREWVRSHAKVMHIVSLVLVLSVHFFRPSSFFMFFPESTSFIHFP